MPGYGKNRPSRNRTVIGAVTLLGALSVGVVGTQMSYAEETPAGIRQSTGPVNPGNPDPGNPDPDDPGDSDAVVQAREALLEACTAFAEAQAGGEAEDPGQDGDGQDQDGQENPGDEDQPPVVVPTTPPGGDPPAAVNRQDSTRTYTGNGSGGQRPPAGGQQPPAGGQQPPAGGQQPPAGGQPTTAPPPGSDLPGDPGEDGDQPGGVAAAEAAFLEACVALVAAQGAGDDAGDDEGEGEGEGQGEVPPAPEPPSTLQPRR